jgi:hypothetical protein
VMVAAISTTRKLRRKNPPEIAPGFTHQSRLSVFYATVGPKTVGAPELPAWPGFFPDFCSGFGICRSLPVGFQPASQARSPAGAR